MYEIVVVSSVYETWDCYAKWLILPSYAGVFDDWVVENYPEVLSVGWLYGSGYSPGYTQHMRITFASEELYQWFLLKQ